MRTFYSFDVSLNSTAICEWNPYTPTKYKYHIYVKYTDKEMLKLEKVFSQICPTKVDVYFCGDNNSCLSIISEHDIYNIHQNIRPPKNKNYTIKERNDLNWNTKLASQIMQELGIQKGDIVSLEGFSFGSSGNSFIDMIKFNQTLRLGIVEMCGFDNFHVYSPATIKKFVGKGNFNKNDMMEHYLLEPRECKPIIGLLIDRDRNLVYQGVKDKIRKPFDDIVDSYWINKYCVSKMTI